jgi:hypothetical protein
MDQNDEVARAIMRAVQAAEADGTGPKTIIVVMHARTPWLSFAFIGAVIGAVAGFALWAFMALR